MAGTSLVGPETVIRVSSVLNRDAKQFGKQYMFDGKEDTCWNSDQGSVQWVSLEFPEPVCVSQIQIQFQGGFSSRKCTVQGGRRGEDLPQVAEFYPEDTNSLQISFSPPPARRVGGRWMGRPLPKSPCYFHDPFPLDRSSYSFPLVERQLEKLKVAFENSTDFFGRIVVYRLDVRGSA